MDLLRIIDLSLPLSIIFGLLLLAHYADKLRKRVKNLESVVSSKVQYYEWPLKDHMMKELVKRVDRLETLEARRRFMETLKSEDLESAERCSYCNQPQTDPDTKFCWACGAILSPKNQRLFEAVRAIQEAEEMEFDEVIDPDDPIYHVGG